jgi:hypothetical protein
MPSSFVALILPRRSVKKHFVLAYGSSPIHPLLAVRGFIFCFFAVGWKKDRQTRHRSLVVLFSLTSTVQELMERGAL